MARMLRKADDLSRRIVVGAGHVRGRATAFAAEVMLNESEAFARKIRPWGKGSDVFFFNLTAKQCAKAGLETNDTCQVTVTPQD